jgi:hypothetical protein
MYKLFILLCAFYTSAVAAQDLTKLGHADLCMSANKYWKKHNSGEIFLELSKRNLDHNQLSIKNKSFNLNDSECDVLSALGRPKRVNTSVNKYGTNKQLVYENVYVYIENGKVTSWSTNH